MEREKGHRNRWIKSGKERTGREIRGEEKKNTNKWIKDEY